MNETSTSGPNSLRNGKDLSLDSPLLNLILAASLLSKLTRSKSSSTSQNAPPSYIRTAPLPVRFSQDYYGSLPWYPHDNQHYYKLQTTLNTHQEHFPVRPHIIHIHQNVKPVKPIDKPIEQNGGVDNGDNLVKPEEKLTTTIIPDVVEIETPQIDVVDGFKENLTEIVTDNPNLQNVQADDIVASPSNQLTQELKDFLTEFFSKNYFPPQAQQTQPQLPIHNLNLNYNLENQQNLNTTPNISDDEVGNLSDDLPDINLDKISEVMSEQNSEITSEQLVDNMSESLVDKMAENLSENATENEVKHMSEKVIQNLPASILENISPAMLEQISDKISEQISEKLSKKFSKDVSNHMLEKLSQLLPEKQNSLFTDLVEVKNVTENKNLDLEFGKNSEENKISNKYEDNFPVYSENLENQNFDGLDDSELDKLPEMIDQVGSASSIDLQASETKNSQDQDTQNSHNSKNKNLKNPKNPRTTDDEYVYSGNEPDDDDDEDEDDTLRDDLGGVEEDGESVPEGQKPNRAQIKVKTSQKLKSTTESSLKKANRGKISGQRHSQGHRTQDQDIAQERINSKKPSHRRKSTSSTPISLIYDDDEDYEDGQGHKNPQKGNSQDQNKKKVQFYNGSIKRTNLKRPKPDYDFEDDEEQQKQQQKPLRQKPKNKNKRVTTTPSYPEYYNDPVDTSQDQDQENQNQDYSGYDEQNQDYEEPKPRPQQRRTTRRPILRQQATTTDATTLTVTDTDTADTEGTTLPITTSMVTTQKPTSTTSSSDSNATSGEYPYYGNGNNDHISITYGPPVHHYPGYGPSNGNEQVSFTYAPITNTGLDGSGGLGGAGGGFTGSGTGIGLPTSTGGAAANDNPIFNTWYSQYARNSMYQRIQDLLTPNNFYNQYDSNYNNNNK